MFQMKEQDKSPGEQLSDVEISNLPEKEFRIMRVRIIQDLGKRMKAQRSYLNYGYAGNWLWCLSGTVFTRPPVQIY